MYKVLQYGTQPSFPSNTSTNQCPLIQSFYQPRTHVTIIQVTFLFLVHKDIIRDVAKCLGKDPSSTPKGMCMCAHAPPHTPLSWQKVGEITIALKFQMKDENTQLSGSSQPSKLRPLVYTCIVLQWCQTVSQTQMKCYQTTVPLRFINF